MEYAPADDIGYYQGRQIAYVKRQKELRPIIERMKADESMPRHPNALEIWSMLEEGQMVLPLDPPAALMDDLRYINLLMEWESLPYKMRKNEETIAKIKGRRNNRR